MDSFVFFGVHGSGSSGRCSLGLVFRLGAGFTQPLSKDQGLPGSLVSCVQLSEWIHVFLTGFLELFLLHFDLCTAWFEGQIFCVWQAEDAVDSVSEILDLPLILRGDSPENLKLQVGGALSVVQVDELRDEGMLITECEAEPLNDRHCTGVVIGVVFVTLGI